MLQLGLLGRPYIVGHRGPVLLASRKGEALLWYLAAQPEQAFTRSHLAALLWGDSIESSARRTLTTVLVTLRRRMPLLPLRVDRDALAWDPDAGAEVDILRFCQAAGIEGPQATHASPPQGWDEEQLPAAVALRRGPFLDGFSVPDSADYQAWLEQQRHLWDRRVVEILERLACRAEAASDWEAVASYSRRALAIDPLQESFHRWLMTALAAAGNRSQALAQYEACRRILHAELAVSPDPVTTSLRDAIAAGALPVVGTAAAAAPPRIEARPVTPHPAPPLVGRDAELRRVLAILQPGSGSRNAVLLHGEAGIGKTRLVWAVVEASARWARTVIAAHGYETAQGFPLAPFVQLLTTITRRPDFDRLDLSDAYRRHVGRLCPEFAPQATVIESQPFSMAGQGHELQALFEAVVQLLIALPAPTLLVLEDLHWADEMSLYLLAYLLRHPLTGDIAVLMTARVEDLPQASTALLRQLQREEHLHWQDLAPLSLPALRTLVMAMTGKEDTTLADRLYRDTNGNPLFALELLRHLSKDGRVEGTLPATLRAVVGSRLLRLPPAARELCAALSVFPQPVPLSLAQEVAGLDEEETVQALDALLLAHILEETGESKDCRVGQAAVTFHHNVVSAVVREEMSEARRLLLHRRAYHALTRLSAGRTDTGFVAEALAEHATQGHLWAEGVAWNLQAAQKAMENHAYFLASSRLHQALRCLAQLPDTPAGRQQYIEIRLQLAHIELLVGPQQT